MRVTKKISKVTKIIVNKVTKLVMKVTKIIMKKVTKIIVSKGYVLGGISKNSLYYGCQCDRSACHRFYNTKLVFVYMLDIYICV